MRRLGTQVRYIASSLSSTGVDYLMLLILNATIGGLFAPVIIARTASCTMNYLINRRVFRARGGLIATAARYYAWGAVIMLLAYASLTTLTNTGVPLWAASIGANSSLFALNYLGQSYLVFGTVEALRCDASRLGSRVAGLLASPAQAAPASESIIASGIYNSSGAGCQGSGTSADCLSWGLRVPSTIAPKKDLTVTIEADSAPGRWAWNCLASDRIAGTAAFYDSPSNKLSESSLKSSAKLHYGVYGDSAGQVEAVTCTPEHLSITYKIDHLVRSGGSYLDLSFGTTTTTPGSGEYTYSFSPTVTTSADNTPQKITATVKKPAENAVPR